MTVRTESLALGAMNTTSTYVTIYTVPAGYRTIVKDIWLYNVNAVALTVYVNVKRSGVSYDLKQLVLGAQGDADIQRYLVLNAADELRVFGTPASGAVGLRYAISGSALDLTP